MTTKNLMMAAPAAGGGGTVITESFNKVNGTLGPDLTWVELGVFSVVSNAISFTHGSDSRSEAFAQTELAVDHYVQAECTGTGDAQIGVIARSDGSTTGNYYFGYWRGGSDVWRIAKFVGGTFTSLAETSAPTSISGAVVRLEASGDNLTLYINGVSTLGPVSGGGSHTTGTYTGIFGGAIGTGSADNFEAGDL